MIKREAAKYYHLTDKEYDKLMIWYKNNVPTTYHGSIGGELIFEFIPTSIGEIISARIGNKKIILRDLGE